jgi:hypothetical protein
MIMAKRHRDAITINEGACNPSGIAHSIVQACQEVRDEPGYSGTDQMRADPALRLMVHQLAFLMGLSVDWPIDGYIAAVEACEAPVPAGWRSVEA